MGRWVGLVGGVWGGKGVGGGCIVERCCYFCVGLDFVGCLWVFLWGWKCVVIFGWVGWLLLAGVVVGLVWGGCVCWRVMVCCRGCADGRGGCCGHGFVMVFVRRAVVIYVQMVFPLLGGGMGSS